jgi:hypothetical protein
MPEKLCSGCGHVLPLSQFHLHPRGKFFRQHRCKTCQNTAQRSNYARRRDQMVAETVQ